MKRNEPTILYIIGTTTLGGAPQHLNTLLEMLRWDKYSKVIACPNDGPFFNKYQQLMNTKVRDVSIRSLKLSNLIKLIRIIKTNRVDLIHSHGKGAGLYGRIAGFLTRTKVVHTFHGVHYHKDFNRLYKLSYAVYEWLMGKFTDYFINVSNAEHRLAKQLYIIGKKSKSKVIYNAINFSKVTINPHKTKYELLNRSITDQTRLIGIVANFYFAKGHEFLIRAMSKVVQQQPDLLLLMIGDGPLMEEQRTLVDELNLQDHILFLGAQKNVFEYLNIMDIFVLCSRWEGMPISLVEAMYMGKPILGTNVTGISELVEHQVNGLLVRPESEDALADALLKMLSSCDLHEMGKASEAKAQQMFSAAKMVSEVEGIYDELLQRRIHK